MKKNIKSTIKTISLLSLLLLMQSLWAYVPSGGSVYGSVYTRGVVLDSNGNKTYVAYKSDGTDSDTMRLVVNTERLRNASVLATNQANAIVQHYQDILKDYPNAEVLTKAQYEALTAPPNRPALVSYNNFVVVRGEAQRQLMVNGSQLILQESLIDPQQQYSGTSILISREGEEIESSEYNIGLEASFLKDNDSGKAVYDVGSFGSSYWRNNNQTLVNPLIGLPVSTGSWITGQRRTITDERGRYSMRYYMFCPGFQYEWTIPVNVELKYSRFNPRGQIWATYFFNTYKYDYCSGLHASLAGATSLTGQMAYLNVMAIELFLAKPIIHRDVPIDIVVLDGAANFGQVSLGDKTRYDDNKSSLIRTAKDADDFDKDGTEDKVETGKFVITTNDAGEEIKSFEAVSIDESPEFQAIWLSGEHDLSTLDVTKTLPSYTRLLDWSDDFNDRALLSEISEKDLQNTDIYLIRESDGTLVTERRGIKDKDAGPVGNLSTWDGEVKYTLQIVNRYETRNTYGYLRRKGWETWQVAGNMNPKFYTRDADHLRIGERVRIVAINRATGYMGSTRTEVKSAGSEGSSQQLSFNIKKISMRPPNLKIWAKRSSEIKQGATSGTIKEQTIGNEGAGLSDDKTIIISTEWLDHDGSPLPEALDDYGFTGRLAKVSAPNTLSDRNGPSSSGNSLSNFAIKPGRQTQVIKLSEQILGEEHLYVHVSGEPKKRRPDLSSGLTEGFSGNFESDPSKYGADSILKYRPTLFVPVKVPVFDEKSNDESLGRWRQARLSNSSLEKPKPTYRWLYRPEFQVSIYGLELDEIIRNYHEQISPTTSLPRRDVVGTMISETDSSLELLYSLADSAFSALDAYSYEGERELIFSIGEAEIKATIDANQQITFDNPYLLSSLSEEDLLTIRLYANNDSSNNLWEFSASKRMFENVKRTIRVKKDVDLVNETVCTIGSSARFRLTQAAKVSLVLTPKDLEGGTELKILDNVDLTAGSYNFLVTPSDLAIGKYDMKLTGVSAVDGHSELEEGSGFSEFTTFDNLPISHALVKGVDLFDGHLNLSSEDFRLPERGKPFNFRRSYSSSGNGQPGVVGAGWSHNFNSRLFRNSCGVYQIVGSEGSSMRFNSALEPLKGFHGSLVRVDSENYNYFTKDGTRYHYQRLLPATPNAVWYLNEITDANGNTQTFNYYPAYKFGKDNRVVESIVSNSGRTAEFEYLARTFPAVRQLDPIPMLKKIEVQAASLSIEFEHDEYANLIGVTRGTRSEQYSYDTENENYLLKNRVLSYTNPNGETTTYTYLRDQLEIVILSENTELKMPVSSIEKVSEPLSSDTSFAYTLGTGVFRASTETGVTNARGKLTTYKLSPYGAATKITDPEGNITLTEWSDDAVVTSRTDANGVTTTYTHDEYANVTSETIVGNGVSLNRTMTYDGGLASGAKHIKNKVKTQRNIYGNTTSYDYDGNGNLTAQNAPLGAITKFSWSGKGDLSSQTDPNGNKTTYGYDNYGNRVKETLAGSISYNYDSRSRRTGSTDRNGDSSTFVYDDLDRVTSRTNALGGSYSYSYDAVGNVLTETNENGQTTTRGYDALNRVTSVTNPAGSGKTLSYDGVGNKTSETDWRGNATSFTYDGADRLTNSTKSTESGAIAWAYSYDSVGNKTGETDPRGNNNTYDYDGLNRLTQTTLSGTASTTITYNDGAHTKTINDPNGNDTTENYDALNRLSSVDYPESVSQSYVYDKNGNKTAETNRNGNTRHFEYDALNRQTTRTNADGAVTTFDYDGNGNITKIELEGTSTTNTYGKLNRKSASKDPDGNTTSYTYDAIGNLLTTVLANGNTITSQYDNLNRQTSQTDTLGNISTSAYDADNNITQSTDGKGNTSTHSYDKANRHLQSELPKNKTISSTWDANGNKLTTTDAKGNVTSYSYDNLNRITTETAPEIGDMSYSYDDNGNVLTTTDREGHITTTTYDDLNRPTTISDALSQTTTITYDGEGNPLTQTDKKGIVTTQTYDAENRLATTIRAGITLLTTTYNKRGLQKTVTDANSNTTNFTYYKRDLVKEEQAPLGATTKYAYDALGKLSKSTDAEGRTTTYSNDKRGRQLSMTNAASETTSYGYDLNNNKTSITHPKGGKTELSYDDANRLTAIKDRSGNSTQYAYDNNDNRTSITDAQANTTSYDYDANNRKISTSYADGKTESYSYDNNSNIISSTDSKSNATTYSYDVINRLTQTSYPSDSNTTLSSLTTAYDANNNPTSQTETHLNNNGGNRGTETTTKTYDDLDRNTSQTDAFNRTIQYGYDDNGNRTRVTDPDSQTTSYTYNALNQLATAQTSDGTSSYSFDKTNLLIQLNYANGMSTQKSYYANLKTKSITHKKDGTTLNAYAYQYDKNGNRTQQVETQNGNTETTTYSFDATDRLKSVSYPNQTVAYSYDKNYNRTREVTTGENPETKRFIYNNRNQLTQIINNDTTKNVSYQFDANGNQTQKTKNGVITTFVYNTQNQLVSVQEDLTTLGQFYYNYAGLRTQKIANNKTSNYSYDGDSVLTQSDSNNATTVKYDYGAEQLLSLKPQSTARQYYHNDALGSTTLLTTATGDQQASYQYDAWGNSRGETGTSDNVFGFTGHEKDSETGLYYFKARYYDPDTARFLNQDSYLGDVNTPPSLHRYLYAYGNPTVYWDADGHSAIQTEAEQTKVENTANDDSWFFPVFEDIEDETARFAQIAGEKLTRSTGTRKTISRKTAQSLQAKTKGQGKDLLILEEGDDLEVVASNIDKVLGRRALRNRSNAGMSMLAHMLEGHGAGDILDISTFARAGQIASQKANGELMLRDAAKDASQQGKKAAAFILNAVAGAKETWNKANDNEAPAAMQRNAREAIISEGLLAATPFGLVGRGKTLGNAASAGSRKINLLNSPKTASITIHAENNSITGHAWVTLRKPDGTEIVDGVSMTGYNKKSDLGKALLGMNNQYMHGSIKGSATSRSKTYSITAAQARAAEKRINSHSAEVINGKKYNLFTSQCATFSCDVLKAAGQKPPKSGLIKNPKSLWKNIGE